MSKRYKKHFKEPHPELKTALAAILLKALRRKRKLLLTYIADNGTVGLLDYADTVLDEGWGSYFDKVSELLREAATNSEISTVDDSGLELSNEFIRNLEAHATQIAIGAAATILGLHYDQARGVAIPTPEGWSIGQSLFGQLEDVLKQSDTEAWSSRKLDRAIGDLSGLTSQRAEQIAHNSLAFVDGAAARATASASGATMKRSESMEDDRVCPECIANQADGWIGINDQFSGSDTEDTPHHYGCRCSVEYEWASVPVLV